MLSRPEIGTRAHIKLWLAGKDPDQRYTWFCQQECACGQYSRQHFGEDFRWTTDLTTPKALHELNRIASESLTFGKLYADVCKLGW